jgi:hypothetical protein
MKLPKASIAETSKLENHNREGSIIHYWSLDRRRLREVPLQCQMRMDIATGFGSLYRQKNKTNYGDPESKEPRRDEADDMTHEPKISCSKSN